LVALGVPVGGLGDEREEEEEGAGEGPGCCEEVLWEGRVLVLSGANGSRRIMSVETYSEGGLVHDADSGKGGGDGDEEADVLIMSC
jgi:hypothetical protein